MTTTRPTNNLKGFYSFVVSFFAAPEDKGLTFHVNQSWLPFNVNEKERERLYRYRELNPTVFPALNERGYAALSCSMDSLAATNNWITQSALARVRPHAFDDIQRAAQAQSDDQTETYDTLNALSPFLKGKETKDRVVIEVQSQGETRFIFEDVRDIFVEHLEKEGLGLSETLEKYSARALIPILIQEHPFLMYVLFNELPLLTVFYCHLRIEGVKVVIGMIRSDQAEIQIDNDWLQVNPVLHITHD